MKKVKWISLFLAVIMLVSVTACQNKEENKPDKKKTPANITVEYYEDVKDSKDLKNSISFTEPRYENDEYLTKIVIKTDKAIKNVKITDVVSGHVSDKITKFYIKDVVYELDKLTPDKPLVFGTVFPNFMANHVISYEDTTGKEKIFSISISGENGKLILAPAEFEKENLPAENANVDIRFIDHDISSEYPGYYDYYDDVYTNPDYQSKVLVSTDQTITDVKIMSGEIGTVTDSATGFFVDNVMYELGELYPDTPLLYVTEFPGDMPSRIISYRDVNGEEKIYSLSMSGYDGSLVTAPVFIEEGQNQEQSLNNVTTNDVNNNEADDKTKSDETCVYIGYDAIGYNPYPVEFNGEMTPEKLIGKIADITGWNLELADNVSTGKGGMTVNFSSDSALVTGPPQNQKDEFRAYDVYSFSIMVLDSVKETLQQNYIIPPGDPNNLDVYFILDGNNIMIEDKIVPFEEPWDSLNF